MYDRHNKVPEVTSSYIGVSEQLQFTIISISARACSFEGALKMVLTSYAKQRILFHFNNGHRAPAIAKLCQQEGIVTNRVTVWRFLCFYEKTGCIMRKEGSGRPSKITSEIKVIVERQMEDDDETTASQLYKLLKERGTRVSITHAAIYTYIHIHNFL